MFPPNLGTPSSFSLTAPQPTEPPETRFASQLQALNEMGFADSAANIRALMATGGNVNSAVEYLLNNP
jgi:ubiquilin